MEKKTRDPVMRYDPECLGIVFHSEDDIYGFIEDIIKQVEEKND